MKKENGADTEPRESSLRDYAETGLSIQGAFLDHAKRFPAPEDRPNYIRWGSLKIATADSFPVPETGRVRAEFLTPPRAVGQGFDLKVKGWMELPNGRRVNLLRTWHHSDLDPVVEYPFSAEDGILRVWNVFKRIRGGKVVEERWTGNSGFWVECDSPLERIYHCSHGLSEKPDFDSLVFRLRILDQRPGRSE